jgi:predicted ATPase
MAALGALVPEWSPGGGRVETDAVVLAEGVLRFASGLATTSAPALLIIEDLHWADRESLAVIDYMADNLEDRSLMMIVTRRTGEAGAGAELASELHMRRAARSTTLGPLDDDHVAEMISACYKGHDAPSRLTEAVTRRSDGIPFFVEELLATALGVGSGTKRAVPASITAALEPRITALREATRDLVRHAALLGRQFDWQIAAAGRGL